MMESQIEQTNDDKSHADAADNLNLGLNDKSRKVYECGESN